MRKLFILCLFITGCGIKANPEVPRAPEVDIRRVGERVYVKSLSGDIKVEGFEKEGAYWTVEKREAFCFSVKRIGGKSKRFCVSNATEKVLYLDFFEEEHSVKVIPSGFESYRLYPYREGSVELEKGREFVGVLSFERDYWERCYFLTGVVDAKTESSPLSFCIKPKPPPAVEEVRNFEIREGKEKLYLVWSYEGEYKEFVLYENGKELERTKGFVFEVPKPKGSTVFRLKVVNPLGFESKGVETVYSP